MAAGTAAPPAGATSGSVAGTPPVAGQPTSGVDPSAPMIASQDASNATVGGSTAGAVTLERGLARGDRELGRAINADQTSVAPMKRAMRPGDPGFGLRPGDQGYAPPARIAQPGGVVLEAHHYDYDTGSGSALAVNGQVPLAMPAPAYETVLHHTAMAKPSTLSQAAATAQLAKMVGNLRDWIMDFPYPAQGELSVIVQAFRDLAARRASLGTAAQLGRTVPADAIDEAETTPPPEFFTLRAMGAHMLALQQAYERALSTAGGELSPADKTAVNQTMSEFGKYTDGPTSLDDLPADDAPVNIDGVGPKDPRNRQHMPRTPDGASPQGVQDDVVGQQMATGRLEGVLPAGRIAETNPQLRSVGMSAQEQQPAPA